MNTDLQPSKNLVDFVKTHSRNESFLYNNRIYTSHQSIDGSFSKNVREQYNVNHKFISEYFKMPKQ